MYIYDGLAFGSERSMLGLITKALFDKITCRECGADVSNKLRHVRWHIKVSEATGDRFVPAWTIHSKTLTEL